MVDARAEHPHQRSEARGSILRSPVCALALATKNATEAVRSHPRGSQRVLELYSLLALNLVRWLVFCT